MSAICGIFFRDGRPFETESLHAMMDALSHRGKDGSGIWSNHRLGLGCQKLWITPESCREQLPFSNVSRCVITAEARIDNRHELSAKLDFLQEEAAGIPDSHLILHAYEKWGENCPEHLEGSFAFAVWDERRQQLFCAVDQLCSRRLYTYCTSEFFILSTEIKGILALPGLGIRLDETGFAQLAFLSKEYRSPETTCFEGIKLMRAATACTITATTQRTAAYWKPDFENDLRLHAEDEYLDRFKELFFHSVHSCLRSSFPVGALLSGGLDSSSIVCTAARLQREQGLNLTGISSVLPEGYPGPETDERQYIDIVRRRENIPVHYVHPPVTSICGQMERVIALTEDPRFAGCFFLTSAFQAAAREHNIRVVLCGARGEYGPSSYGGGYLPELALSGQWWKLGANLRDLARVTNASFFRVMQSEVIAPLLPETVAGAYARLKGRRSVTFAESLIARPDFFYPVLTAAGITPPVFVTGKARVVPSQKRSAFALFGHLCTPSPMNAMWQEQEMAFPFANKRLMEFCLALPGDMKIRRGWKRYLLRAGMEGILPPEIQWRQTKGPFSPDFFRRVAASRKDAVSALEQVESDSGLYNYVRDYVDLNRMRSYAKSGLSCETWTDWRGFEPTWQLLLRGLNVIYFLKWARSKITTAARS